MAKVYVDDTSLKEMGNAIREKNGEQTKYKPSEMPAAIRAISGGGGGNPFIGMPSYEYLCAKDRFCTPETLAQIAEASKIDKPTRYSYMFLNSHALTQAPDLDMTNVIYTFNMFEGSNITSFDLDVSKVKGTDGMFNNCRELTTVTNFDFSTMQQVSCFKNTPKLTHLTFNPNATRTGSIQIYLEETGIVNDEYATITFNSLPQGRGRIYLKYGCPISDAVKQIARDKGYAVD